MTQYDQFKGQVYMEIWRYWMKIYRILDQWLIQQMDWLRNLIKDKNYHILFRRNNQI